MAESGLRRVKVLVRLVVVVGPADAARKQTGVIVGQCAWRAPPCGELGREAVHPGGEHGRHRSASGRLLKCAMLGERSQTTMKCSGRHVLGVVQGGQLLVEEERDGHV